MIPTSVAAKILGFSIRHIQTMCSLGVFVTASRPGYGERAHYKISRSEVVCKKYGGKFTEPPTIIKGK